MLTISEIAARYNISNRQVHDLVDYGYLNISRIHRNNNRGIKYLFSESEITDLDVYSLLEEIKERKKRSYSRRPNHQLDFKKMIKTAAFYETFFRNADDHPEGELLKICFYLFHLNHYAKRYTTQSTELYTLKKRVLRKIYSENSSYIKLSYLVGPDRTNVWLCEDCKETTRSAGISYAAYIREGNYCPKCSIKSIDKEYYSLIEFKVTLLEYRFSFHLPLSSAVKWIGSLAEIPPGTRKIGNYPDKMYLYGRSINRIEEKVCPLTTVKEYLLDYLGEKS